MLSFSARSAAPSESGREKKSLGVRQRPPTMSLPPSLGLKPLTLNSPTPDTFTLVLLFRIPRSEFRIYLSFSPPLFLYFTLSE